VGRYQAAVKWNPGYAEAFWKLGLAEQKLAAEESSQPEQRRMLEAARQAFEKYLKLSPRGKKAKKARKQLARLGRPESPPSVTPPTRPR
jgi:predicted TPR repeat methyltransferase